MAAARSKCGNGQCILSHWKCDKIKNCMDGSDEVGCGSCSSSQFRCRSVNQCISASYVCDKDNDCADGSDEAGCPSPHGGKCGFNSFRCDNNRCIHWTKACNGRRDCTDGSDETGSRCRSHAFSGKKRSEIPRGVPGAAKDGESGTFAH
ncbi:low-density lipoprotein receptor-like [Xenia sp. Carnegie-2017]|uniref:low-density lipoprotein receptor-like n=1 Tax=Xenia sp. Carnegie-2017 TaxID=2897299 RepID=UPI001F03BDFE|nr:low-density lipoprotein receptor-like [Xenia sp. Carnegie-2017]